MAIVKKIKKAQNGLMGGNRNSARTPAPPSPKRLTILEQMDADARARSAESFKLKPRPSTAPKTDSLGRPIMQKGGKIKKAQSGKKVSGMYDFQNIYTGEPKSDPGIIKAKADKAKRDSVAASYKKKFQSKRTYKSGGKISKKK
jgi:hypothetical protein